MDCTDLYFPNPNVLAITVSIFAVIPSYHLTKLIVDCNKEIFKYFDSLATTFSSSSSKPSVASSLVTLCENDTLLNRLST
ncbi:TPLATE protein [Spatholobus suberectus]|nr:TPLATE protein [Spatholobus suberectus]